MATPSITVDGATLQKVETRVGNVFVHLKKLHYLKNRLRSPLLRLPTETVIRILSYIMEDYSAWCSIFKTCHRLREIIHSATELWSNVDLSHARTARLVLTKMRANPRVIIASPSYLLDDIQRTGVEEILDHWKGGEMFLSHRLHTFKLSQHFSDFASFSWILERPLPRLEHLKIHIDILADRSFPAALPPLPSASLRVLDLRNAAPPWSSIQFTGLSELHLDLGDCGYIIRMEEDELLRILGASPQLQRLSLVDVGPMDHFGDNQQLSPERVVRLPNLTFLKLGNILEVVRRNLVRVDAPSLAYLDIFLDPHDNVAWWSNSFFPNGHFPKGLFSNPPALKVGVIGFEGSYPALQFHVGGFSMLYLLDENDDAADHGAVTTCLSLVPPSIETVTFTVGFPTLGEGEWREFFTSHPEVRSIECSDDMSESFWDSLSSAHEGDQTISWPKLESIVLCVYANTPMLASLLSCLQYRRSAGFKLRHLEVQMEFGGWIDYKGVEDLRPFVEVVEAGLHNDSTRRVGPVLMSELNMC